ncbi:MAG: hypothetical protein N4A62_21195 [Marinisporobacter sp.]|jgi:hypothetical protein|nr:hypothetical protein [Marinisporobacter sp.]
MSLKYLCEYLNTDFEKIIGFNPMMKIIGNRNEEEYTVYVSNTERGLVFTFGCEYEKKEGLDEKIQKISKIDFIKIFYMRVTPTGVGIGTRIWGKFLKRIENLDQFKTIRLSATKPKTIKFWKKIGFKKDGENQGNYEKMIFYL